MEGNMKALMYRDIGKVECVTLPIPECGPKGITIEVARASICGSDIHAYNRGPLAGGLWGKDVQFGHEFVGIVVEVGDEVEGIKIGDRVWVNPDFCKGDPRKSCMAGGFAEYASTVDARLGETVFILPDNVPFKTAVLLEPMGVGVHTKNRAGVKPGDKVMMIGAGPIGLMGWAAMRHQGIKDIIAVEYMPSRVEFARGFGVEAYCNQDKDSYEIAAERFGTASPFTYERADVDAVIDYAGLGSILGEYLEKGRGKSTFTTLGLDPTSLTILPNEFMSKEFTVKGARGYTPEDIRECIDLLADGEYDLSRLVTAEYPLDEPIRAFEAACGRDDNCKVVFNISD